MELNNFKNIHSGKPIFIAGSGKSIDFLPSKRLFKDCITIGVNCGYRHIPVDYIIVQHHTFIHKNEHEEMYKINKDIKLFVSEHDVGDYKNAKIEKSDKYITYKHNNQPYLSFAPEQLTPNDDESLFVGCTTIIVAISLAIYMGAKTIILSGIDNGSINGESNYVGYYNDTLPLNVLEYQHHHSIATNNVIKQIRTELIKKGVFIASLSPFLDYKLEGNSYDCQRYEI